MPSQTFHCFFERATEEVPYPYQVSLTTAPIESRLIHVPTGCGKTAAVILSWLWQRKINPARTPRRLAYCLPMRVLVEQTRDNAIRWLHNLEQLGGEVTFDPPLKPGQHATPHDRVRKYAPRTNDPGNVAVYVLMGGEDEDDWDIHPECDAIIIGTQDMLMSRALNRGYAASRARWPMQFGLLHTDCLWVFDEIQLMGAGLATTTQLEGFRWCVGGKDGHGCRSVWMSATMQRDWLKTVDFKERVDSLPQLELSAEDHKNDEVKQRWEAKKPRKKAQAVMGETEALAEEVRRAHRPGARTIVVVNTVRRACELFDALKAPSGVAAETGKKTRGRKRSQSSEQAVKAEGPSPKIVLLHSRFRPGDRTAHVDEALADPPQEGTIVVSTQVIEAGVDVSATTLFTELAPWASLVQRFGRCNRRGGDDAAQVFWIDLPTKKSDAEALVHPYRLNDLRESGKQLKTLKDVGPRSLPNVELRFEHSHVIRRKDLIDLFDTTPDLAGNDIDIDRFVREVEDSDVRVFWRDYGETPNERDGKEAEGGPRREELCPAPIGSDKNPGFREFAKRHKGEIWRWNFLDKKWEPVNANKTAPGQVFLVHAEAGGYTASRGWDQNSQNRVEPVPPPKGTKGDAPDANEDERLSRIGIWQTIAEHTNEVCREMDTILAALAAPKAEAAALRTAARWHDWGKAHHVFQNAIDDGQPVERRGKQITRRQRPEEYRGCRLIAKAPGKKWVNGQFVDTGFWRKYDWLPTEGRRHFRHELASALAVLLPNVLIGEVERGLVAYLIAAHHGKVRLSIRSLPNEFRPDGGRRFARGIWGGDKLPATDLGGGVTAPAVTLSLEPMELGLCAEEPFDGHPSWAERMIRLRDTLGPFRLAYLEALLRAADMRASRAAEQRKRDKQETRFGQRRETVIRG